MGSPTFNRFDIVEAYNVYCHHWNVGQWSMAYACFGRIQKLLCRNLATKEADLTPNGKAIYAKLVRHRESRDVAVRRLLRAANGRLGIVGGMPYSYIRAAVARSVVDMYRPKEGA